MSIHIPLLIGFLPGFLFLVYLINSKGVSYSKIFTISLEGIKKTRGVIYILLLVGFLLPSWYLSGTIEQLVTVSLHLIAPAYFLMLSFIVASVFSMILGTSVGTLSAVGIPIMSTGISIGHQPEIIAGALIAGAFVGDRTSPFSSAHQLLAHTLEISVKEQFKAMLPTTLISIVLGIVFFSLLDAYYQEGLLGATYVNDLKKLSFITFIPPLVLIGIVLVRIKILYAFILSISSACLIALYKLTTISELSHALFFGVEGMGGGFINMYLLLLFLGLAGAYNGLLEEYKIIQSFLDEWLATSFSLFADTVKTMIATTLIAMIAANQTLPIILTGRSFLSHWKHRYSNAELSRVMGDSTMLVPGMLPWSVLAIMCSTIVGVPLLSYLPYAIFLWLLPLLTIGISLLKVGKAFKRETVNY
ncbi:Na+/H+ antiporter NhaC family protein [Cytobacillus luteolus]|uniref:Na+/H+ antiporter NhaC family protein n=1 Tax=Litchfieldia luteola TaxID=682179 RepID=UPI001CB2F474|nr:Na+/H+ antiporter NhaC family protein [Cytobacillus luteolus]MBP1943125.1 NhaC family Na+:H+ antiporter [Cytobacillus luteolus]